MNRVNPNAFKQWIDSMPLERRQHIQNNQQQAVDEEYDRFKSKYSAEECYVCGKPFKTITKDTPCIHWLLRRCKFKAKDFPKIVENFDYHQISSYLRWIANEERYQGNINDLSHERSENKVFQTTIKWKNIEWTFDCSNSDYSGHAGTKSNYPHYHFQMRIDGKQFINFNTHHIPFSEKDLFNLDLNQQIPESVVHTFGPGGSGMQDAVEIDPEVIIEHTTLCDSEEDATYHLQTIIMAKDEPMSGDALQAMIEESNATGQPLAQLAKIHMAEHDVKTFISPVDTVPDIAKRTERKRK